MTVIAGVTGVVYHKQPRAGPMSLWMPCWNAIWHLRPAFSRLRSFLWFATAVAALHRAHRTARRDQPGARAQARGPLLQQAGRSLSQPRRAARPARRALWDSRTMLRLFPQPLRINGRCVVVGDSIKVPKRGRKMPGVKLLHQQSESNTKPEYIMPGHLPPGREPALVQAAASVFAVPLAIRIHEGWWWSNRRPPHLARQDACPPRHRRHRTTLLLRRRRLLCRAQDRRRPAQKENNHLVTRVSPTPSPTPPISSAARRKRGRPRVYGRKVRLNSPLEDTKGLQQANSPVYGERRVVIQYKGPRLCWWRPAGRLVRFVAVIHPTRGSCLLMCTDTSLAAIEIIRLNGLRFKIEHTFKQAVRLIGSFSYHFWMSDMKPLRRRSGNQRPRASPEYRDAVRRKLHAYHVFIQAAVVCQGLLQ